jgi:hypothetical protein
VDECKLDKRGFGVASQLYSNSLGVVCLIYFSILIVIVIVIIIVSSSFIIITIILKLCLAYKAKLEAARQVHEACTNSGFLYIQGKDVRQTGVQAGRQAGRHAGTQAFKQARNSFAHKSIYSHNLLVGVRKYWERGRERESGRKIEG